MEDFIDKFYEVREETLAEISSKDKEEILKVNPQYYGNSKFEDMLERLNDKELSEAFEDYKEKMHLSFAYIQKKFYLNGLKDGAKLFEFCYKDK